MTPRQFAALLGFGFVAAWIGFSFGEALLCLVGALAFVLVLNAGEQFLRGELDLGEVQSRLRQNAPASATAPRPAPGPATPPPPRPATPARPASAPRVR